MYELRIMSILCPYCLDSKPRRKIFATEIQFNSKGVGKKTTDGINLSVPEIFRSYQCPRCKTEFNTRETLYKYQPGRGGYTPKIIKDIIKYDERKRRGLERPRKPVRKDIQYLILKVFGEDIRDDIEQDVRELEKKWQINKLQNII